MNFVIMTMSNSPEKKDFIKDLGQEGLVSLSEKIKDKEDISQEFKSFLSVLSTSEDFHPSFNEEIEKVFNSFLESNKEKFSGDVVDWSIVKKSFDEWKIPDNLPTLFEVDALKNYLSDMIELNEENQQEIMKAFGVAKDEEFQLASKVTEDSKIVANDNEEIQSESIESELPLVHFDFSSWLNKKQQNERNINKDTNQLRNKTRSFVESFSQQFKFDPFKKMEKSDVSKVDEYLNNEIKKLSNSSNVESVKVQVIKGFEEDLNRLWKGKDTETTNTYVLLTNNKLSSKENGALKDLLYKKGTSLEGISEKDGKRLYGMMKHLNTETVFSAIENIQKSESYGAIFAAYATLLRGGKSLKWNEIKKSDKFGGKPLNDALRDVGYYPKSDKGEISEKEFKAFLNLYGEFQTKEIGEGALILLADTFESGKIKDINYTKHLLDGISETREGEKKTEILGQLLMDLNYDGRIVHAGEAKKGKNIDQGGSMGYQIGQIYNLALSTLGEKKVINNMVQVLSTLHSGRRITDTEKNISTASELIELFRLKPGLLSTFRNKLMSEPLSQELIFTEGVDYAKNAIKQIKNVEKSEEQIKKLAEDVVDQFEKEESELYKQQMENLIKEFSNQKERIAVSLNKMMEDVSNKLAKEKDPDKKEKLSKLLQQLQQEKAFLDNPGNVSPQKLEQLARSWIVSGVAAGLSYIDMADGVDDMFGVGLGTGLTNVKWNSKLAESTKGRISNISLTGGAGYDVTSNKIGVAIGPNVSGGSQLWNTAKWFYSGGASLSNGGVFAGLTVGLEQQLNPNGNKDSLDAKSAKYIGATATYTGDVALQLYYRRNKIEGIDQKAIELEKDMKPLFEELFKGLPPKNGESFIDAVYTNLQKKFPNTRGDTLYLMSKRIHDMMISYGGDLKDSAKLSELMTENFVNYWRNNNLEKLNGKFYLSQVGIGTSFVRSFAGFLGLGSLSFEHIKDIQYVEKEESYNKILENVNNPNAFSAIRYETQEGLDEVESKLIAVNRRLSALVGNDIKLLSLKREGDNKYISLSLMELEKLKSAGIQVVVAEELVKDSGYIKKESETLLLPYSANISLASIVRQKTTENYLALGTISLRGTVSLDEEQDFNGNPLEYGVVTVSETKNMNPNIEIDGKPTDELLNFLNGIDGSAEIVDFRYAQKNKGNSFAKAIHALRTSQESDKLPLINACVALLPTGLKNQIESTSADKKEDNLRYIYASMSRVSQTIDKQLDKDGAKTQAENLLSKLSLSTNDKTKIQTYIDKVFGSVGGMLDEAEYADMKKTLKVGNNWNVLKTTNARLHNLLAPASKIAKGRDLAYDRIIKGEYKNDENTIKQIKLYREQSIKSLDDNQRTLAEPLFLENYVTSVAGYGVNQVEEKFIGGARVIDGSLVKIENPTELLIRNYFDEMKKSDMTQYNAIISSLEKELKNAGTDLPENFDFVRALLDKNFVAKDGKAYPLEYSFQFGLFADCINESIIFGDLKLSYTTTIEKKIQPENEIYTYLGSTSNSAEARTQAYNIGILYGKQKSQKPENGTTPEPGPEGNGESGTLPIDNIEGLEGQNGIESVDGNHITINGKEYDFMKIDVNINGQESQMTWIMDGSDGSQYYMNQLGELKPLHDGWENGLTIPVNSSSVGGVNIVVDKAKPSYSKLKHVISSATSNLTQTWIGSGNQNTGH